MSCGNTCTCGCCEGVRAITPRPVFNRPGLDQLAYRIGDHGAFLETMKARLSSSAFPALANLSARTTDDPSIAILDAWATIADVLTFYQERLANEGYLRTATESRSVRELAALVGYTPRPGVASTVYLAYEIDSNAEAPVEIPAGSRVQSLPGPGELPQTFETSDPFIARREWNAIKPRTERPQSFVSLMLGTDQDPGARIYLQGASTGLKVNDPILLQIYAGDPSLYRVTEVIADSAADRTLIRFEGWNQPVEAPPETLIRRALLLFNQTSANQYAPGSVAQQILAETSAFLIWFMEQASADDVDPEVLRVLDRRNLVESILETMEGLRQIATSPISDGDLVKTISRAVVLVTQLPTEIQEFTNLSDGGKVGHEAMALAVALQAVQADQFEGNAEDRRVSILMRKILTKLALTRSIPPRNSAALERDATNLFDRNSDVGTQAVSALQPALAAQLPAAIRNAQVAPAIPIRAYALRQKALLFASTAPRKVTSVNTNTGVITTSEWTDADINAAEETTAVYLELPAEKVKAGSWVALDYQAGDQTAIGGISWRDFAPHGLLIARAGQLTGKLSRAAYNTTGQTTRLPLLDSTGKRSVEWFKYDGPDPDGSTGGPVEAFQLIRRMAVFVESEELPLALEPMDEAICGGDQWIETGGLFTGLETGRWLTISGERSDVPGTSGVKGSELVMLDAVRQYVAELDTSALGSRAGKRLKERFPRYLPGETLHTFIKLATPLAYCYKRATVTINANVVKASHGETRQETLGSGDASLPLQSFVLRQPPLTHVPANEPDGISSTLNVYVNGMRYQQAEALIAMQSDSRMYLTRTADDGTTTVVFGNGVCGMRLPTGVGNVMAIYRNGIGRGGNVKAGQISQLLSRPLGVKGVLNPIEASGGAGPERRDQARRNAPLAVMALDRLVATRDYAEFSRTFAGIGKAASARIFAGGAGGVHVTIAGAEDIPILKTDDLYRNLSAALRTYGDPSLAVHVELRELMLLVLSARVRINADYLWDDVVARVRASLLDRYSFERQELGQSVVLSEVISLIQSQRGVDFVDVDALGAVTQFNASGELRSPQDMAQAMGKVISAAAATGRPAAFVPVGGIRVSGGAVLPAQICFFIPSLPETLLLNRIED